MIKRPQRGDTEDDILQMEKDFWSERAKNSSSEPAAKVLKLGNKTKTSMFAQNRSKENSSPKEKTAEAVRNVEASSVVKPVFGEIQERNVDNADVTSSPCSLTDVLLGAIVERHVTEPKFKNASAGHTDGFPKVIPAPPQVKVQPGKSVFASIKELPKNKDVPQIIKNVLTPNKNVMPAKDLSKLYGNKSVIVDDENTAAEVHKANLEYLSKMKEDEILVEREKLLNTIDPTLVDLLRKRRSEKLNSLVTQSMPMEIAETEQFTSKDCKLEAGESEDGVMHLTNLLSPSNVAVDIFKQSESEQWLHFDVVESDKLAWLRDIPSQTLNVKTGTNFEARFDWKGVLLPYSVESQDKVDDRELYLHGDEPYRAGYTLQELFRLARSNVMQQRVSAFGAIAGILSIYNQGFYDNVLELPISKIFFLLRFGLDDNTPSLLEVTSKALAFLFYNETDETLLDFVFDNPGGQWQPILEVLKDDYDSENTTPIENLQRQFQQLQMNNQKELAFKANVENNDTSRTTMSDFHLAETDLIDCLLRTNILQRFAFILNTVRPQNSTVSSCLKILIRIARTEKEAALKIVTHNTLINCLFANFLPDLGKVDVTSMNPPFYDYPQYLCLKLLRTLVAQNKSIAIRLLGMGLIEKLQNYLFYREDLKNTLIKVQIECLRILRCLFLMQIDLNLYGDFLPVFCFLLKWHCNNLMNEDNGSYLLRQHASALLMVISSQSSVIEINATLEDMLLKCCCSWFYRATRNGVKEESVFSQLTLLSASLNVVTWCMNLKESSGFNSFNTKYLLDFLKSDAFHLVVKSLISGSIIARQSNDRRSVHPPLPNVGGVLQHQEGPQLIIPQIYSVFFIKALWGLLELHIEKDYVEREQLIAALSHPQITENLFKYLKFTGTQMNRFLATNFFAKTEVQLVYKLLNFENFKSQFSSAQNLQIIYNFMCCLTAELVEEIKLLFDQIIFSIKLSDLAGDSLQKWRDVFADMLHSHAIIVHPTELSLSKLYSSAPVLPFDWPYFFMKVNLRNYLESPLCKLAENITELEAMETTLTFVAQLQNINPELQIATPTEELMYLMIAFMGPESAFLSDSLQTLLRELLLRFYAKYKDHNFEFDKTSIDKCKFESLYSLFVNHFQAASYGDELFGSLVLVPLAQKYDSKWRRRMWSDDAPALYFLNCDEKFLMGGLQSYLQPPEEEMSLLKAYSQALQGKTVRPGTIPYRIAEYHIKEFKKRSGIAQAK